MIWFITGAGVMLALLALVGITRGRFVSQKGWVITWTIVSFSFAAFIVTSVLLGDPVVMEAALGGSLGFVVAISIHVLHHAIEEIGKDGSPSPRS